MEEILKIPKGHVRHLSWEIPVRCLVVIISVLLLVTYARDDSKRSMEISPVNHSRSNLLTEVISERFPGTNPAFTTLNTGILPAEKINISEIIPHFVWPGMITNQKDPETIPTQTHLPSALPAPVSTNGITTDKTDNKKVFHQNMKSFSVQETSGSVSSDESSSDTKNIAIPDIPLDSAFTDNTPNEITVPDIIISTYGNGGIPATSGITIKADAFSLDMLEIPKRPGKLFDGWYLDAKCSVPFIETDTITPKTEHGIGYLTLYAGWKEFPGFLSNDSGYITGCSGDTGTTLDGFLVLPIHESCLGIANGAFDSIADDVMEIYIPENIVYIEEGALDNLNNLIYIEVAKSNPVYYSEKGILYYNDGMEATYPAGRKLSFE